MRVLRLSSFLKTSYNKMKLKIEQVGKGGLPPLLPDHLDWTRAGVNHPSPLVQFERLLFSLGAWT